MTDAVKEHRCYIRRDRKTMVFNKIFRLRCLILVVLAACVFAVYYYILRDPEVSLDDGFLPHNSDFVIADKNPVQLDVYYESLCPDSRSFFLNHLLPTVHKFSKFLTVNLIPYGRAETIVQGGNIEFKCQHGQPECHGNKIHACVIQKSKSDMVLAVNVTSCLFEDYFQPAYSEKCCQRFGLKWNEVSQCVEGQDGSVLLKNYGDLTNRLLPIDFIPTIAINKHRGSKQYQGAILKDLSRVVCKIFERKSVITGLCGE